MRFSVQIAKSVVACALASLSLTAASGVVFAKGASSLCVNPSSPRCYHTIQAAVNAATSGTEIVVSPGTYHEDVNISGKWLTLRGHGSSRQATINASGLSNGLVISGSAARGTSITGFTIQHANLEGILLQHTSDILISNNTVQKNDLNRNASNGTCPGALPFEQDDCGEGLHLNGVNNSQVSNNLVTHNAGGILLTDEVAATHDNVIANNRVLSNPFDCGITLASHPVNGNPATPGHSIYHNTILKNVSEHNGGAGVGIFTPTPGEANHDNAVIGNVLEDNDLPGVALHAHAPNQNLNGNQIIGNYISGNAADDSTTSPTGIAIFSDKSAGASPITGTVITYNTIAREQINVWIGTTATNLSLHANNFSGGKTIGVQNGGTGTIDATENYWGCRGGPFASGCSTIAGPNVRWQPFLTSRSHGRR